MTEHKPLVSVIICSYNRARYIATALQSLYEQTAAKDLFEVIVVDNNSHDNTEEVCHSFLEKHPDMLATYMTERSQGSSFARNAGAHVSKGEFLVFMDDDADARPDFIANIIRFFKEIPNAGGGGGRIIPKYIPEEPKWMSHFVSSLVGNFNYSDKRTPFREGKYPLESNMAVKREAFFKINGFNTDLPGVKGTLRIGGEGKDFFYRLIAAGYTIHYDPSICVEHVVETQKLTREYMYRVASGIGRGERVRIAKEGRLGFFKKLLEYGFKLGAAVVLAIVYTLKGHPKKAMPVIHFRIDAIKGLLDKTS